MNEQIITAIGVVLISSTFSLIGTWLMLRVQAKRVPSQNFRDDVDTARIALEIAEKATARQLEQEKKIIAQDEKIKSQDVKIQELKSAMKEQHYKLTMVFSSGDQPKVEMATIESVKYQTAVLGSTPK